MLHLPDGRVKSGLREREDGFHDELVNFLLSMRCESAASALDLFGTGDRGAHGSASRAKT